MWVGGVGARCMCRWDVWMRCVWCGVYVGEVVWVCVGGVCVCVLGGYVCVCVRVCVCV